MRANSYIGAAVNRLEDYRFLTGRGIYAGDLSREDMLHAVVVRSPLAHRVIRGIDCANAKAMPGVHASNRRTYSYGAHAAHVVVDEDTSGWRPLTAGTLWLHQSPRLFSAAGSPCRFCTGANSALYGIDADDQALRAD